MGKLQREMSAAPDENLATVEQRNRFAEDDIAGDAPDRPFDPSEWRWREKDEAMVNCITGEVLDCDAFQSRIEVEALENPFLDDDYVPVARPKTGGSAR